MRASRPVMAEGKGENEDTSQKALQIELVSLRSCRKTSLCDSPQRHYGKRTMAQLLPEEERAVFYPGPTGPRASEWHREPSIPGGKLLKKQTRPLTDQFHGIWKTHFPKTGHHHPEGSCGQQRVWLESSSIFTLVICVGILQGDHGLYLMTFKNRARGTNTAEEASGKLIALQEKSMQLEPVGESPD